MVIPSCTRRSASDCPRAWESVFATMNSTPSSEALIMLFTAFPPAPPTPTTVIRGLISDSVCGRLRLIVIRALHARSRGLSARSDGAGRLRKTLHRHRLFVVFINSLLGIATSHTTYCLKIFPNPTANATNSTCRRLDSGRRRLNGGVMLKRKGQQTGGSGKCRPAGRIRESCKAQRCTGTHFLVENCRRNLWNTIELAASADQDGPSAGQLIHTARLQTAAHEFERLLDTRADDADQNRARHVVGARGFLLADQRHVDDVVL